MEEDLKILEELLNANVSFKISPEDRGYKALENLIKGYREIKEENRIFALVGSNIALKLHIEKNYISKSKIKEKLEEFDKEYHEILKDYGNIDTDVIFNIPNENVRKHLDKLVEKIIVLQELMEDK